jgi:hypothetical protein
MHISRQKIATYRGEGVGQWTRLFGELGGMFSLMNGWMAHHIFSSV